MHICMIHIIRYKSYVTAEFDRGPLDNIDPRNRRARLIVDHRCPRLMWYAIPEQARVG